LINKQTRVITVQVSIKTGYASSPAFNHLVLWATLCKSLMQAA